MHIPKKTMCIAVVIFIVAIAVLVIGIISHNKTKSTNHKQLNDNVSSEVDKPDADNVLDEKEYYDPDGMEVLDDETEDSQETTDAPASWDETPSDGSSQNTTSKDTSSDDKNDKDDKSDAEDTSKTNDDEDGLPDEEDRTETKWGTVF